MSWTKAATVAELDHGPVVFRQRPKQIALFKVRDRVFAVDNRCPHEGYPLAQGTVEGDCLLTCNWHNWKFRLEDGQCVLGGDHVRSYPVERRGDELWVNIASPPCEEIERATVAGLQIAFEQRDYGRICREISRLHFNKLDPLIAVRAAVGWYHDKLEFGTTHASAAAADWLALAQQACEDWEERLICMAEAVDHMAFDALRHPVYPYAQPQSFDPDGFLAAVERGDAQVAEGQVRGALDAGLSWADLHRCFAEAALAHYNDFGHSLIYVFKSAQLLDLLGPGQDLAVLLPLARHLCYTTREDLLPEFDLYGSSLQRIPPLQSSQRSGAADGLPFPATTQDSLDWLVHNAPCCTAADLYDALLSAAARNWLHFDTSFDAAYDRPVNQNVGWLDFTHAITFANALRHTCTAFPDLWPQGLAQLACFVGRNRHFLDLQVDTSAWLVDDADAYMMEMHRRRLDHGLRDPIFSAHVLKTSVAVADELPCATPATRRWLLAGLNRCIGSPWKQKHTRRLARQAIDLVGRDFV